MASSVPAPYSTALYRITYAWGLAFAPHALKIILLGNSGYKWDNKIGINLFSTTIPSCLPLPHHELC